SDGGYFPAGICHWESLFGKSRVMAGTDAFYDYARECANLFCPKTYPKIGASIIKNTEHQLAQSGTSSLPSILPGRAAQVSCCSAFLLEASVIYFFLVDIQA